MLKFGQKEVTTKDFYGQRQITDLFTIDVSCSIGKDCRYIAGYQVGGVLTPLFIKTPKNIFSYGVSQYKKSSAYTMSFNVSEEKGGWLNIKRFGNRLSHSYLKKWRQDQ